MVPNDEIVLSRQELLDLVWSRAASQLAPELGVSDSGLAKICRRHLVPRPPRGFFLMRKDRRPAKPEFVDVDNPDSETIRFRRWKGPERSPIDPAIASLIAAEDLPESQIRVSERLNNGGPLASLVRRHLLDQRVPSYGPGLVSTDPKYPSVAVHPTRIPRAIRILDALVKAADKRGYKIHDENWGHRRGAVLEILGETVPFKLKEKTKRTARELTREERATRHVICASKSAPTVRGVSVAVGHDRPRWRLEDCLNDFFVSALRVAADAKARRLEREERSKRGSRSCSPRSMHGRGRNAFGRTSARHGEMDPLQLIAWALEQAERMDPLGDPGSVA